MVCTYSSNVSLSCLPKCNPNPKKDVPVKMKAWSMPFQKLALKQNTKILWETGYNRNTNIQWNQFQLIWQSSDIRLIAPVTNSIEHLTWCQLNIFFSCRYTWSCSIVKKFKFFISNGIHVPVNHWSDSIKFSFQIAQAQKGEKNFCKHFLLYWLYQHSQ